MSYAVILIDDAIDLRTLVTMAIKRDERLEVAAAVGDGQQGLDAIEERVPDVVLMDLSMPVMDGLTTTRELKRRHPDLPIVIFTGYGDERLRGEASKAGADAFVDKSQPLDEVLDLLVSVVTSGATATAGD